MLIKFSRISINRLFDTKPPQKEISKMRFFTNYRGEPQIYEYETTLETFANSITNGVAFYPAVLEDKGKYKTTNANCFKEADIVGIDLEGGAHTEENIKSKLIDKGIKPCFVYRTYSHQQEGKGDRNRAIFKLPYTITNKAEYLIVLIYLYAIYGDMDTSCIELSRLFLGSVNKEYQIYEEVLNLEKLIKLGNKQILEYKETDSEKYLDIIKRFQKNNINCALNEYGAPAVTFSNGKIVYTENLGNKVQAVLKQHDDINVTDDLLKSNGAKLNRFILSYWYDKALTEPLFKELVESTEHYGYKKAVCLVSNYRFIGNDDVFQTIFGLLKENGYRFSDINNTIAQCKKIWELPAKTKEVGKIGSLGFGSAPLPYSYCDLYPQNSYEYPLTYLRNATRRLQLIKNETIEKDFIRVVGEFDFIENPKGLVINGGMGLGKTYSTLTHLKEIMDKRYNKSHKVVFLTSRRASKEQIDNNYKNFIETQEDFLCRERDNIINFEEAKEIKTTNKIVVMTVHNFTRLLTQGVINNDTFDIIINDEAQSTIVDSFAEQMGEFLLWAQNTYKGIVIWLTANGRWFKKAMNHELLFPTLNLSLLYKNEGEYMRMRYNTSNINFSNSSNIDYILTPLLPKANKDNRILVFMSSAAKCYRYYLETKKKGYRSAFYVSDYCDTEVDTKLELDDYIIKELDRKKGVALTLSEAFNLFEDERGKRNVERVRDALLKGENYPEDIDIIFTTDVLRESININEKSKVKTIITDSYNEVNVLQQRGRIRSDIEVLTIVPQRQGAAHSLESRLRHFEELFGYSQQQLALEYGKQTELRKNGKKRNGTAYVLIKEGRPEDDTAVYCINLPAYVGLIFKQEEYHNINMSLENRNLQLYVNDVFGCLSSGGEVNILYEKQLRERFINVAVSELYNKYKNLPLIDVFKDELIKDAEPYLTCVDGGKEFTLNLVLRCFRETGKEIKDGKVGKKQIKAFNLSDDCLGKKYRMVI